MHTTKYLLVLALMFPGVAMGQTNAGVPASLLAVADRPPLEFASLLGTASVPAGLEIREADDVNPRKKAELSPDRTRTFPAGELVAAFNSKHADYRAVWMDGVFVIRPVDAAVKFLDERSTINQRVRVIGVFEAADRVFCPLEAGLCTGGRDFSLGATPEELGMYDPIALDGSGGRKVIDTLNQIVRQTPRGWYVVTWKLPDASHIVEFGFLGSDGARTPQALLAQNALAASASRDANLKRCKGFGARDVQIAGCTALIESGQESGRMLAGILSNRARQYRGRRPQRPVALLDYDRAVQLAPDDSFIAFDSAEAYREARDYDRAMQDYNRAVELDPTFYDAVDNRGTLLTGLGRYEAAIADFTRALAMNAKDNAVYFDRGLCYEQLGRDDLAVQDFSAAFAIGPVNSRWMERRATAYFRTRDYDRALADYEQSLVLEPRYPPALYGRGVIRHIKGDPAGGDADVAVATMLQPDIAKIMAAIGVKP